MQEGVALAAHCIDTGKAMETLERFLAGEQPGGGGGMTILEQLAAHARQRVAADREANSLDVLQAQCRALGKGGGEGFQAALAKEGLSFLCEVKKASPSKGVIAKDFPLPGHRPGLRGRRGGGHLLPHRAQVVSGVGPDLSGDPPRQWPPPCSAKTLRWTPTSSTKPA